MSFAPSPTRAAATGAATASRLCWGWPRRPRCAAPGATRRSTSGVCDLSPAMLRHFRCRRVNGAYERPSIYCLRNAIVKVAPEELDAALRAWFSAHGHDDASLAIDGKTMKGAVDEAGRQVHILGACGHDTAIAWGQKKTVLTGDDGSDKRTNEIGVAIPLLDQLGDLAGKTVTADALLTQTAIASYLRKHDAHYMFVAKDNQKTLLNDIRLWFHDDAKRPPDFAHTTGKPINGKLPTAHGRWEQREIWTTTALNDYLLFPGVGQAFLIRAPAAKCARAGSPTPRSTPPGA